MWAQSKAQSRAQSELILYYNEGILRRLSNERSHPVFRPRATDQNLFLLWVSPNKSLSCLVKLGNARDNSGYRLGNIHPGEILQAEFLNPFNITAYRLAKEIKIPQTRISQMLQGRRRITADTALRLSEFFGNSAQFWLGLQDDYDLEEEKIRIGNELRGIQPIRVS